MDTDLSIFDIKNNWLKNDICIQGVKDEIREAVFYLGGITKTAKFLNIKYTRIKEWCSGRSPIPLNWLEEITNSLEISDAQIIREKIISKKIFVKTYSRKDENCVCGYFASKATHWYLRSFFNIKNGYKNDLISIPEAIIKKGDKILWACLCGLFDSDGTITKDGTVKFASTSKKIADQIYKIFLELDMKPYLDKWLKNPKFKTLYTIRIKSKHDILKFADTISFNHPKKLARLDKKSSNYSSPVV